MDQNNIEELTKRIAELESELRDIKAGFFRPSREETVLVPEPMKILFDRAQKMIHEFFQGARSDPSEGTIEIDGDRYILVRASALSTNFFDTVARVYADRGREEAEAIGRSLLFDLAHTIGLNDARNIHRKMGLTDPIEKLSAGPVHFAYAGWAFVDIRPESNPVPSEDFVIMYDHPYSFEAHTWLAAGRKSEYPVCVMNAGYSSGWCEESFGIPLTAVEVTCRAKGDAKCTFLMAPPHRIVERVREYFGIDIKDQIRKGLSIPAYFERKVAEDKLRDSERMFRAVVDQTYQFIGLLKTDGTLIDVNETALAFSGIVKNDVMNKPFWEGPWWTHSPELQDKVRDAVKRTAAGDFVRFEATHPAKDGSLHYVDFSMKPVRDEEGKIIMLLPEGRDITERKMAEQALRESEERFSQIVNRAVVGVFRTALDGMALLANPAVMKMFDFDSVESFNAAGGVTNFYQSLDDRQRLFAALTQGPVTAMEIPFHRRDRSVMILSLSAKLVRDDKGNPAYIEGTLEDISERKKVEQALRESEERFSQIVNRAVVGVFRTSMDGKALLANPAVLRVFGFDTIETFNAGGGVTPLYQNLDDRLRLLTALMKGPVYGIEIPFYRRDRTGMILSLSVNLERDEKGNPLYIEGTMEDITARKKAEQALRESEERFTQVVNRAIVGVFRTDLNGLALLANPAVLKIFDYDTIEAFNADGGVTHLYQNADDRQRLISGLMKGTVSGMEMPFYRRDGSNMFLAVSANLMRDEKGNPMYIEGTLEDVTIRKKAELALRDSEEKYRILFDSAGDAIFIHTPVGRMLAVNRIACERTGYTWDELMSRGPQSVDSPDESAKVQARVASLMEKGHIVFETTHIRKDGSLVPTEVNAQLITFNGEPAIMAICRDITERRESEVKLQHTLEELKRSNRELEEFASVASHDLQEPLRKILTFSDRIRTKTGDSLDPESQDYLTRMQSAATRMQILINDLLSYSRVTTQAKPFVPVDLTQMARDVLVDLELRIRPDLDRVDIADLPTIEADPGQIRQLLYNLLSNALKFHRADQPALVMVEGGVDKGRCLIRVRDNGIGFDEKYRESIFGIFKRLHSRSEYEGTGVGLAICKKIAERHGGNISASSTPGQGATFEVTLPVRH